MRRWWRVARERLRVAERLDPQLESAAAWPLYRDGVRALACAAVAAVSGEVNEADGADVESAWAALERVWPKLDAPAALEAFAAGRELLRERPTLDAPRPDRATATAACQAIDRLARCVERAIEPRTMRQVQTASVLRVAPIVIAPIALAAWLVPPMFAPKSLALHKRVAVSSSRESEAPPGGGDVVNGVIEHTYGMQTNEEDNPWVLVDLERPTYVARVVVYNRGDGWFDDCLPLVAEVGNDEKALRVIATRDKPFSQHRPWELPLHDTIRFIRLSKKGHGYITLAEIAAYAK